MNEEESHGLLVGSADDDEHEFEINLHENGWSLANGRNSDHCHNNLLRSRTESKVGAERILLFLAILCTFFIVIEFTGGYFAHSIAIMTDAGHMLSDLLSTILSIVMIRLSSAKANRRFTFGYLRAEFVGALMSLFVIWVVTTIMLVFATQRIMYGTMDVDPNLMMIMALIGIIFNLFMGLILKCCGKLPLASHGHNHSFSRPSSDINPSENVNIRAAFIHVLGDFMQSVGVFIASFVIKFTGFQMIDPLCTYIFSIVVIITSIPVAKDIFKTLMEGTPKNLNCLDIQNELSRFDGVKRIHNLHIWSLGTDHFALSVHLVIEDENKSIRITKNASTMLKEKYGIHYATVQTELPDPMPVEDCNYCLPLS